MRYEVRVYNLEEMLPENRMTYLPCDSRDDAKLNYFKYATLYDDPEHYVQLCKVEYGQYGESVTVVASTKNDDPFHLIWDDEWISKEDFE